MSKPDDERPPDAFTRMLMSNPRVRLVKLLWQGLHHRRVPTDRKDGARRRARTRRRGNGSGRLFWTLLAGPIPLRPPGNGASWSHFRGSPSASGELGKRGSRWPAALCQNRRTGALKPRREDQRPPSPPAPRKDRRRSKPYRGGREWEDLPRCPSTMPRCFNEARA